MYTAMLDISAMLEEDKTAHCVLGAERKESETSTQNVWELELAEISADTSTFFEILTTLSVVFLFWSYIFRNEAVRIYM